MDIYEKLISTITLLSNHKSFNLCVGSTRTHLWLLMHFKHLEIYNYQIQYQVNKGIRQRKSTVHPKRWLKKHFSNTAELLEYLSGKRYDIHHINIEFVNGWKIKELFKMEYIFYTNSTEERNLLIDKLLGVAGLEIVDKSVLTPNITYLLKATGEISPVDNELSPDEFWTKDQLDKWKEDYCEKDYCENYEGAFCNIQLKVENDSNVLSNSNLFNDDFDDAFPF